MPPDKMVPFGLYLVGASPKRTALSATAPFLWSQWQHLVLRTVWKWSPSVTRRCLHVWLPHPPTVARHLEKASGTRWQQDLLPVRAVRTAGVRSPLIPQRMQRDAAEVQGGIMQPTLLDSLHVAMDTGRWRRCVLSVITHVFLKRLGGGVGNFEESWLGRFWDFVVIYLLQLWLSVPITSWKRNPNRLWFRFTWITGCLLWSCTSGSFELILEWHLLCTMVILGLLRVFALTLRWSVWLLITAQLCFKPFAPFVSLTFRLHIPGLCFRSLFFLYCSKRCVQTLCENQPLWFHGAPKSLFFRRQLCPFRNREHNFKLESSYLATCFKGLYWKDNMVSSWHPFRQPRWGPSAAPGDLRMCPGLIWFPLQPVTAQNRPGNGLCEGH